jgi:hypothetical protein
LALALPEIAPRGDLSFGFDYVEASAICAAGSSTKADKSEDIGNEEFDETTGVFDRDNRDAGSDGDGLCPSQYFQL